MKNNPLSGRNSGFKEDANNKTIFISLNNFASYFFEL